MVIISDDFNRIHL